MDGTCEAITEGWRYMAEKNPTRLKNDNQAVGRLLCPLHYTDLRKTLRWRRILAHKIDQAVRQLGAYLTIELETPVDDKIFKCLLLGSFA